MPVELERKQDKVAQFTKFSPFIVTVLPAIGPFDGETAVTVAAKSNKNGMRELLRPQRLSTTSTSTVPALPGGVLHLTKVDDTYLCSRTGIWPTYSTMPSALNPSPVTSKVVPPSSRPRLGITDSKTEVPATYSKLPAVSLTTPPALTKTGTTPSSPGGVWHVMLCGDTYSAGTSSTPN